MGDPVEHLKGFHIPGIDALQEVFGGWVEIEAEQGSRRIGVIRVHLEEDTGKLVHQGRASLIDYNRAGVPLMEIVSDSSLRSTEQAHQYLLKIRQLVRYLGASSGATRREPIPNRPPTG